MHFTFLGKHIQLQYDFASKCHAYQKTFCNPPLLFLVPRGNEIMKKIVQRNRGIQSAFFILV